MPDQKIDNLLNLAMEATPQERAKSENLNVGYDSATKVWDVIIKYSGPESGLGGDGIQVVPLFGGYAGTTSSCSAYPAENLSRRTRPHKVKRFETCRSKRGSERCSCHTFKRRYDSSASYRTGTASQTGG